LPSTVATLALLSREKLSSQARGSRGSMVKNYEKFVFVQNPRSQRPNEEKRQKHLKNLENFKKF
jgi:hypothetical protein